MNLFRSLKKSTDIPTDLLILADWVQEHIGEEEASWMRTAADQKGFSHHDREFSVFYIEQDETIFRLTIYGNKLFLVSTDLCYECRLSVSDCDCYEEMEDDRCSHCGCNDCDCWGAYNSRQDCQWRCEMCHEDAITCNCTEEDRAEFYRQEEMAGQYINKGGDE